VQPAQQQHQQERPMPANPEVNRATAPSNGATSLHDLFVLTDEQILEIEPEPQNLDQAPNSVISRSAATRNPSSSTDDSPRDSPPAALDPDSVGAQHTAPQLGKDSSTEASLEARATSETTGHETRVTAHVPATPPQWLAERMADPQLGAEARELWNAAQLARQSEQARQEASAFREVFAKPEDARAAAQRARLLDDVDRLYFAGNATQRAELAASMLREDPAAFREMVFAGLRALEQSGQGIATPANGTPPSPVISRSVAPRDPSSPNSAELSQSKRDSSSPSATRNDSDSVSAVAQAFRPEASNVGAQHVAPHLGNLASAADSARNISNTASESSHQSPITSHHLAAYAAFERAANADLERTVGAAIDRTLDQALPNANRADAGDMKSRLAASIRQDIERALKGDRQLGEQVAQILGPRRLNDETRAQVVRLIGDRAHQLVPTATRRVLNEWTQTTLASHRARTSRADAAVTRREIEPARSPGEPASADSRTAAAASSRRGAHNLLDAARSAAVSRSATSSSHRLDYRRLSDEQILNL
jgi:hypothetical protein